MTDLAGTIDRAASAALLDVNRDRTLAAMCVAATLNLLVETLEAHGLEEQSKIVRVEASRALQRSIEAQQALATMLEYAGVPEVGALKDLATGLRKGLGTAQGVIDVLGSGRR